VADIKILKTLTDSKN